MSNLNLRSITNSFLDVRLVSLKTWRQANEINPRDNGGPYIVMQEGYDPQDVKVTPGEFVLGRSGKWLGLHHFFKLPVAERRAEFVFGQAAEVMQMMSQLPSKVALLGKPADATAETGNPGNEKPAEPDEMAAAFQAGKGQGTTPGAKG
jgi:hypothetical protein